LPKSTCRSLLAENAHDVGLFHDQQFFVADLDFRAGPLAKQDAITLLDVQRNDLAALVAGAGANGNNFTFLGLFLGGIGDDDAAFGFFPRCRGA
jgi:lipoprotein NlpI